MELVLLIAILILAIIAVLLLLLRKQSPDQRVDTLLQKTNSFEQSLGSFQSGLKEDFKISRDESATAAKDSRTELGTSLKDFRTELTTALEKLTQDNTLALDRINKTLADQVDALIKASEKSDNARKEQAQNDAKLTRDALTASLKTFQDTLDQSVKSFNDLQREKFGQLESKQSELIQSTEKKLEAMRATVEEKLEKTLTDRIGQSFALVGTQLENVQKGLGEMQTIAQDVGGLKKVLSNVKARGVFGEVLLANLLEQVLAPEQYDANVKTKAGSNDAVEFAIKLPGGDGSASVVYLPIDAKFPKDAYEQLMDAYEQGELENSTKAFDDRIKSFAKTIRDKYIDPPNTTDFALMFLPFESMYAEVIRKPALVEVLQRDFKVLPVGPMNLAGFLNSLQMGFRTLAIQQRASEVWKVLGAVKTEFEKFGGLLDKAKKHMQTASDTIDLAATTRTRAIQRKLREVQSLPVVEAQLILPEPSADGLDNDDDEEPTTTDEMP